MNGRIIPFESEKKTLEQQCDITSDNNINCRPSEVISAKPASDTPDVNNLYTFDVITKKGDTCYLASIKVAPNTAKTDQPVSFTELDSCPPK